MLEKGYILKVAPALIAQARAVLGIMEV